ncbi:MAG: DUF3786 domain-containing protein [Desulfobacterales bacterium]
MTQPNEVFEKNCRFYLDRIAEIHLGQKAGILGAEADGNGLRIPFFGDEYRISSEGIFKPAGKRAGYSQCIILFKHILLCPDEIPEQGDWTAYREFPDAGPLTVFFAKDVELSLARDFSGRKDDLEKACAALGGIPHEENISCDLAMQFQALPRIPVLLIFHDGDEEFPAHCSMLFRKSIGIWLDMESVAVLGKVLTDSLKQQIGSGEDVPKGK